MEATAEGKEPGGNNTLVRLVGEAARQTAGFARKRTSATVSTLRHASGRLLVWCQNT